MMNMFTLCTWGQAPLTNYEHVHTLYMGSGPIIFHICRLSGYNRIMATVQDREWLNGGNLLMGKSNLLTNTLKVLLIIVFGTLIISTDSAFISKRFSNEMKNKLADLQNSLVKVSRLNEKDIDNYEIIQEKVAELAVYYLNSPISASWSRNTLVTLCDVLSAEGLYITDRRGHILSSSEESITENFVSGDFSDLFDISPEQPISNLSYYAAAEASEEDDSYEAPYEYYVSACIDENHIIVVRDTLADLYESLAVSASYSSLISGAKYGKNGLCFSVYSDGFIEYFPDSSTSVSESSQEQSVPESWIKEEQQGILTLYGTRYFCVNRYFPLGKVWLFCAIPLAEIRSTLFFVCLGTLAAFGAVILIMHQYSNLMIQDILKKRSKAAYRTARNKLVILLVLCLVFTAGISVYSKTLYLYASWIRSDNIEAETLRESLNPLEQSGESGSEVYSNALTIFTRTAALLIAENPEFRTTQKLNELIDILGVDHVLVYDQSGTVEASDLNYTGLSLSNVSDSLSGEFRWVLRGEPILIQNTPDETYLNHPYLFSAAPIVNKDGEYDGMVQLAVSPIFRDGIVESASLKVLLSSFNGRGTSNAFAFTVDKENKILHSAKSDYDGLTADEAGLTSAELREDYMGFITLQRQKLLGCCRALGSSWAFIASYTEKLPLEGFHYGMLCALPAFLGEFLFFLILLFRINRKKKYVQTAEAPPKTARGETWAADERIFKLLRRLMFTAAGFITMLKILGGIIFDETSLYYFVFEHSWPKSIHIFSITHVLFCISIVLFVMVLMLRLLSLLISLLPSKQETILRMTLSFVKYIGALGALLYCLTLIGIPTTSLLASAGVMTIVLSMGAQSLVADILSGLFIIFEGTFKVGDMITVNEWHGQVTEIGIRNTTIRDLVSSDVKIINNSMIKNVINYSVYPSYTAIKIAVDYDTDLQELEKIIEREKPTIKKNLPTMIGDLMYLGVDELADSAVILKFQAACSNQYDLRMKRALNREIKLMFDRNGIKVPFPQVVLSERENTEEKEPSGKTE